VRITAAVVEELHGPFVVREVDLDDPGPGDVLVKVAATGSATPTASPVTATCPFRYPASSGTRGRTVVAVGEGVTGVQEGQDVVLGWPSCGTCRNCQAGQPRYCLRLGELVAGGRRPGGSSALRGTDGSSLPATSSGSRRSAPTR
jgi:aryl-alcohol dehydrogenase